MRLNLTRKGFAAYLGIALLLPQAGNANAQVAETPPYPTFGSIERSDARLHELIPEDAQIERLATGFEWTEGTLWLPEQNALLFSDIPRNSVFQWDEASGLRLFLHPSGYTGDAPFTGREPGSNGLLLDPEGRLVLCQHGDRRVVRLGPNQEFITLADRYEGKRLNSPNDGVFDSEGNLYFTDPPYGLPKNVDDPAKELDFQGVFRLSPDGELTLLTREMSRPNGIALSPDERILYVANSDPKQAIWMAFDIQDDGSLANGRVFADVTAMVGQFKGLPDGMKVDQHGNLFATGPGGVHIYDPDGTLLGRIETNEATANCAFGDDGSTLYIAADMHIARVKTKTKGLGF